MFHLAAHRGLAVLDIPFPVEDIVAYFGQALRATVDPEINDGKVLICCDFRTLLDTEIAESPYTTSSSSQSRLAACVISCSFAAVTVIVCTRPQLASTPMWHFMPNRHSLPFFVWYISGARAFSAFFVELGALMIVASTMVPPFIMCPACTMTRLMASKNNLFRPFASNRRRNLHSVASSGTDFRHEAEARKAAHGIAVIDRILSGWIRQVEPDQKHVHRQDLLNFHGGDSRAFPGDSKAQ